MLGETHTVIGGVATGSILFMLGYTPSTEYLGNFFLAVGIGSVIALLPDIDQPQSKIRRFLGLYTPQIKKDIAQWKKKKGRALAALIHYPFSLLFDLLAKLLPHRGPTHWLLVAVTLTLIVTYLSHLQGFRPIFPLAFAIGYLSHLIADSCTVRGIPLWRPFHTSTFRLLPKFLCIKTGSRQEAIMATILLLPCIIGASYIYFNSFN